MINQTSAGCKRFPLLIFPRLDGNDDGQGNGNEMGNLDGKSGGGIGGPLPSAALAVNLFWLLH